MSATCSAPVSVPTVIFRSHALSRRGAIALAIRLLGAVGMLLSYIVLARSLRPAGFSEYAQAIVWLQIFCVFGKFGLDNTSLRYVSEYTTRGEAAKLRGFVHESMRFSSFASGLVMFGVIGCVLVCWDAIGETLARCLILTSIMIPLISLRQIQEASLRSVGRFFESQISTAIWPAALFILAGTLWLISPTGLSSSEGILTHLASIELVSILVYYFFRHSPLFDAKDGVYETCRQQWSGTAMAFFAAELLVVLKARVCVAMAGAMLEKDAVGLYAAMERFADVSLLGSQSLGLVIAPQFASLFAANRFADMRRLMWRGQILFLACTLPVAFGVACFGDSLFVLLGEEYRPGSTVLLTLLGSACISAFAGPAAYVLQMTGHERTMLTITGACAATNVLLSCSLMPSCGILGLGIAQIVTSLVWTVGIKLSLRRHPVWQNAVSDRISPSRGVEIEVSA